MYHSILVPLDGSRTSEHALSLASQLARASGATLHLLHVHAYADYDPMEDDHSYPAGGDGHTHGSQHVRTYLEQLCKTITVNPRPVISTAIRVVDGSVVHTILEYAHATASDLIVMTTHGYGGLARHWLGSVAERLVRESTIPVLVVRGQATEPLFEAIQQVEVIIVALDGSAEAEAILAPALELSRALHASMRLLHIVVPQSLHQHSTYFTPIDLDPQATRHHQAEAQGYLDRVAQSLTASDVHIDTQIQVAHQPAIAILDKLQQVQHPVVAMTTHARGALARFFMGSVADKVMRAADGPVLLCHPEPLARD